MDDRAQISAEMMMVLAILVGVAILLMNMMMNSATSFSSKMNQSSDRLLSDIDRIMNSS